MDEKSDTVTLTEAITIAIGLHQQGHLLEAKNIYQDILNLAPEQPDVLHYIGVLSHQMSDSTRAVELIEQSLALVPAQPSALNNLGNVFKETGRLEAAEETYLKVLEIAPDHVDTWCNLGVVLRQLRNFDQALEKLRKALELQPEHALAHYNLGNVYRDLRRNDEAIECYRKAAQLKPGSNDSPLALAALHYDSQQKEKAVELLEQWLAEHPDDVIARHDLAAYSGLDVPLRASDQYVQETFDKFAPRFDEALERIGYRAPALIADGVRDQLGTDRRYRTLDIGCGTGLAGALLKPLASTLTGVDLSNKMLQLAEQRGIYDTLVQAELTAFLGDCNNEYDLVVCADTFVYFGDLAAPMLALNPALAAGGWCFFTVEKRDGESTDPRFHLQHHGRYCHTAAYVAETVAGAGLKLRAIEDVVLRSERGEPVKGLLVALSDAQKEATN